MVGAEQQLLLCLDFHAVVLSDILSCSCRGYLFGSGQILRAIPSMPYPVHCRVLVFLVWDILGRGDVSVRVPAVAVTSVLSPCCGRHSRGGGLPKRGCP